MECCFNTVIRREGGRGGEGGRERERGREREGGREGGREGEVVCGGWSVKREGRVN